MKRIWEIAGTITLILLLFVRLVNGRTIAVGTGLGYDYDTIQEAINAAQENDTVVVAQGRYTEPVIYLPIGMAAGLWAVTFSRIA